MKIIFYRDESGEIKNHHPAPKDMTQEELEIAIEKYNDGSHGRTAEAFIRRAWRIGKPFAFLLKAQFWNAGKRRRLFEECTPTLVLPLTWRPDFFFKDRAEGEKGSLLMDVQWCVWHPNNLHRAGTMYWPLARPNGGK